MSKPFEITPAGKAQHNLVTARRTELMTHILGAYRPEELPMFADMLERFAVNLSRGGVFIRTRDPNTNSHCAR